MARRLLNVVLLLCMVQWVHAGNSAIASASATVVAPLSVTRNGNLGFAPLHVGTGAMAASLAGALVASGDDPDRVVLAAIDAGGSAGAVTWAIARDNPARAPEAVAAATAAGADVQTVQRAAILAGADPSAVLPATAAGLSRGGSSPAVPSAGRATEVANVATDRADRPSATTMVANGGSIFSIDGLGNGAYTVTLPRQVALAGGSRPMSAQALFFAGSLGQPQSVGGVTAPGYHLAAMLRVSGPPPRARMTGTFPVTVHAN
jgi:hypothetical protein